MMIRPQILVAVSFLGGLAFFSIWQGMSDIATGCVTLIGALSMKILEKEQEYIMQLKLWPKDPNCSCEECTCDQASFGKKRECDCMKCDCKQCHEEELAEEWDTQP